jgi:hypothetical protein
MALVQINVSADKQNIVTGTLLLISVIVPNIGETLRRARAYLRRRAKPPHPVRVEHSTLSAPPTEGKA